MTMSMDLFGNAPRSMDGGPLANAGLTLHFHAHVDLHVTVVRHDQGGQRIAGMEIGEPVCSETGELPMTHPANVSLTKPDPSEQWLMKHHPAFAAYAAKLRRELEAGPATAEHDEIDDEDEGEPTDEAEAQRRPRWFGRRKTEVAS